uniref:Bm1632 n=1 Tax=Brugia malayi TaxID=6279 RepID=A0A1I9G626_BRUMA|nr:Bm1632 [Brugia malayi]
MVCWELELALMYSVLHEQSGIATILNKDPLQSHKPLMMFSETNYLKF